MIPFASGTPPSCAFTVTVSSTDGKDVKATDQDGSDCTDLINPLSRAAPVP